MERGPFRKGDVMKTKLTIALVALVLVGCASQSDLEQAQSSVTELQDQVTELQSVIDDSKSENSSLSDQLAEANDELTQVRDERDELQAELNQTTEDYNSARSRLTKATSQLNQLVCSQQIDDMKYDNILDASTIVAAWWARQSSVERVQGTYRDSIWSNADTKIHAVRYIAAEDNQPYVEHFLIYFREFGMTPGVFWVGGQCWLDAP